MKLLVASVVDPLCAREPRTKAVTDILKYWGFDYRPIIDNAWIGWPSKLLGFIEIAHELAAEGEYTHLMFIDARDIVLLAGPDEVMKRWHKFNHSWVFIAEPFIWSPGSFQPSDYPTPQCVYRYLNGGASIGEVVHISAYFNKWTDNGKNLPLSLPCGDQDWLAEKFIEDYPDAIMLDHECTLFQCMCGSLTCNPPQVTIAPGRIHNKVTRTDPLVIHFNGGDDITDPTRSILWKHWL